MVNRIYGLICKRSAGSFNKLKTSQDQGSLVFVMRKLAFVMLASIGVVAVLSAPASASVWDEARKVCVERYNDEVKSGSVPNRMTKDRYVKQCQASYVRSAKLEDELEDALGPNNDVDAASGNSLNGQGGPEDLLPPPPVQRAKAPAAPAREPKVQPRFKPAN